LQTSSVQYSVMIPYQHRVEAESPPSCVHVPSFQFPSTHGCF
jgi:hypothetical protein